MAVLKFLEIILQLTPMFQAIYRLGSQLSSNQSSTMENFHQEIACVFSNVLGKVNFIKSEITTSAEVSPKSCTPHRTPFHLREHG